MGLLEILSQLGQGVVERDKVKAFGPDYRERWQRAQDEHTRNEIQNAVSTASLKSKTLEDAAKVRMAIKVTGLSSTEEALAKIKADEYSMGIRKGEADIGLAEAQTGWHRARPDLEEAKNQRMTDRDEARGRHEQTMESIRSMSAAAYAGRERGTYIPLTDEKGQLIGAWNPTSKRVESIPTEVRGSRRSQMPPTERKDRAGIDTLL